MGLWDGNVLIGKNFYPNQETSYTEGFVVTVTDNGNLKGLKDVLSWFIEHTESSKDINGVTKPDFSILPDPPNPIPGEKPPSNPRAFRKKIRKEFESSLDGTQLEYWSILSPSQQGDYLFGQTAIGRFVRNARKRKKKKPENSISHLKLIRKGIEKGIRENNSSKWDYNKIDWDIT